MNQGTFSVILRSLDQVIPREDLEEASTQVPSIARADCQRMHRFLAGILISRLKHPEALAFQRGLAMHGHAVDVVADAQIPALPPDVGCQRVKQSGDLLVFQDVMGRDTLIPLSETLFIAGAVITEETSRLRTVTHIKRIGRLNVPLPESQRIESSERIIRLDVFFQRAPHRFRLMAGETARFFVEEQAIHIRAPEMIAWAFQKVRSWAPATNRLNRHILDEHPIRQVVSPGAYESEIRWRFLRLREGITP